MSKRIHGSIIKHQHTGRLEVDLVVEEVVVDKGEVQTVVRHNDEMPIPLPRSRTIFSGTWGQSAKESKRSFFERQVGVPSPVVFMYRRHGDSNALRRCVFVIEVEKDYVKGFDLVRQNYRTFLLDRIGDQVLFNKDAKPW